VYKYSYVTTMVKIARLITTKSGINDLIVSYGKHVAALFSTLLSNVSDLWRNDFSCVLDHIGAHRDILAGKKP